MSKDYPVQAANMEAMREQAVEVLVEHFSRDVMGPDEFEGLLDAVNRCSTAGELRALLAKLPPLESSESAADMIPARGGQPVVVDADRIRKYGFLLSLLGSTKRTGRWIPARKTATIGLLGWRLARLSGSVTRTGSNGAKRAGALGQRRNYRPARDGGGGRRSGPTRRLPASDQRAAKK